VRHAAGRKCSGKVRGLARGRGTRTYDHERLEKPHHEPTPEQVLRQFRDHGSDQSAPYCAPLVDRAPGFISTTPHRSIDGTKVTMYGQWLSAEDYQAMRQDPGLLPFLQEALTIAVARTLKA
jgi:hypothetical protein